MVRLRQVRAEAADGKQTQTPCGLFEGRQQIGCQESVLRLKYQNENVEQFKGDDSVTGGCEAPLTLLPSERFLICAGSHLDSDMVESATQKERATQDDRLQSQSSLFTRNGRGLLYFIDSASTLKDFSCFSLLGKHLSFCVSLLK